MNLPSMPDDGKDSDDLQALFDSVAATVAPPVAPAADTAGDSADLQALFDSVAASVAPAAPSPAA
jgi:chemotaxis protein CheZ